MKKILQISFMLFVLVHTTWAQERLVSGKVTSTEDGLPLPGVNVILKGTTTGTATDADGKFSISVPSGGGALIFSFIGLESKEIEIGDRSVVDVSLSLDVTQLSEVVVTAIGLEREKKALGYSIQSVKGDVVSQKATNNVFESLQGKVAGLSINQASGAPGGGSTILIRGVTSLGGANRNGPLIVIDGTPIDNSIFGTDAGGASSEVFGSGAVGNRAMDVNPEDIESISVLKGPKAASLYGIRAANGAIIITTKRARGTNRMTGTLTSSYMISKVNIVPEYQNQYGQGSLGRFSSATTSGSYGRKFGSIANDSITDHNGLRAAYKAYPGNNTTDFYNTGYIATHNLQLSGGSADNTFSLSIGRTDQAGIIPNSELDRTNLRLAGSSYFKNGFSIDGSINYINTNTVGSPQGNSGSSVFFLLPFIPRSYDLAGRPYVRPNGTQNFYSANDHPLWSTIYNPYTTKVNRFIGTAGISYQLRDWISLSYKSGFDVYTDSRKEVYGVNSRRFATGQVTDDQFTYSSIESTFLIGIEKDLSSSISLNASLGHNVNVTKRDRSIVRGSGLLTPNIHNILNTQTVTVDGRNGVDFNRRLVGVFADVTLGYKDFVFLNASGRNDWSSTLPESDRSFFYPSVSISFLPLEAFGVQSKILSMAKLRANWAQVGNDADPFSIQTVNVVPSYGNNVANINFPFGSTGGFTVSDVLGNDKLRPEKTTGFELGTELGFLSNRIKVDLNYYDQRSEDQILSLQIPTSTGFGSYITNAGLITNKGVELNVNGNVLTTSWGLTWDATVNFFTNRSEVVKLAEGLSRTQLSGFVGVGSYAIEGEPFGVFIAPKFARDPQTGKLLVVNSGNNRGSLLPGATDQVVGDPNPDWNGSFINTLGYKGFRFSFQVDMQKGGDVFSNTIGSALALGSTQTTANDRESPRMFDGVQADPNGNIILQDGQPVPNNIQISAQAYWTGFSGGFNEFSVFDASYIRLREVTLGYSLPVAWLTKLHLKSVDVSLTARNLLTYAPNLKGYIDPEVSNQAGSNTRGLEFGTGPGVVNYGASLRLTF